MGERAWQAAYNGVAVPAMWLAWRTGALWNAKARAALAGRRGWQAALARQLAPCSGRPSEAIWFHTTSVGELEQAKPLMSALYGDFRIVATCFSPSVAPALARWPQKDAALYLPLDSRENVRTLMESIRPRAVIFSKFDVWPNCVWHAAQSGVPVALVAGTLHASSSRLRPVARHLLSHVHRHFALQCAVTDEDADRLRALSGPDCRVVVTGDTRYDQVYARAAAAGDAPVFRDAPQGFRVVAGSTYEEDERALIPAFCRLRESVPGARLYLVPHEPAWAHLRRCEDRLRLAGLTFTRLSHVDAAGRMPDVAVLLVDRIGVLAGLYRSGDVAFVGGSFRSRVHNVMEPAVCAKPVLVGPCMDNSPEAYALVERGAAIRVATAGALADALLALASDATARAAMGNAGRQHVMDNLGATERTLDALRKWVLPSDAAKR
jgi:3-deoxy-D-manno-octulosonic-acid transferase